MKVVTTRTLWSEDIRRVCIDHSWYTRGDAKAYVSMLDKFPPHTKLTDELLTELVLDIEKHSDLEKFIRTNNLYREDMLSHIAYVLVNDAAVEEIEVVK